MGRGADDYMTNERHRAQFSAWYVAQNPCEGLCSCLCLCMYVCMGVYSYPSGAVLGR